MLAAAVLLAAYGNLTSIAWKDATPAGAWPGVPLGLLPAIGMLTWARHTGLTRHVLGLDRRGVLRSATVGLLVALAVALPAVVFLRMPPLIGAPVSYSALNTLSTEALIWRGLVWMPLDTALPEEIAFRGALLGALLQRFPTRRAVLWSALTFTAWHVVIVVRTLAETNLADQPVLAGLSFAGALASIFVGGVVFAALRVRTGHLAASAVMHWAFNAALLFGLYAPP
jgi:membrane protease YdiL (CAAX protease family)